ncbi:hypothetical protein Q7P35_006806 [Cladosporium inversicolor]
MKDSTTDFRSCQNLVLNFDKVGRNDVALVGGKNSSLGEMIRKLAVEDVPVPPGFATTAEAYWLYVDANGMRGSMARLLQSWQDNKTSLVETSAAVRSLFIRSDWPPELAEDIWKAYCDLPAEAGTTHASVAVRSSATAEDLPDASFAGQQESYLHISGRKALFDACKRCYASLFTERAISYRQDRGFDHMKVALSIGVQLMVRSDRGGSGVMFTIDTESGFDKVLLINAAWGLGENVVQGTVDPDEYQVYKPLLQEDGVVPIIEKSLGEKAVKMVYGDKEAPTRNVPTSKHERASFVLNDHEILQLARWGCIIERHYGSYMDIEWARDGITGEIFVVQARPETVHTANRGSCIIKRYSISGKGKVITQGSSVGEGAASGSVCLLESAKDIDEFVDGAILVTKTTDPDWVPIMKRAAAIVTDHGGRTSHAAIVSREIGVPAVVGTGNATQLTHTGQEITVSCAEGDKGFVYEGISQITVGEIDVTNLPSTRTNILLNLANPATAFRWWQLPADGIGLARMEFVISNVIQIHPMALCNFDHLRDTAAKEQIVELTKGYAAKPDFFVDKLACGLARLCAVVHPKPAIIRLSDFKTNEYANLIGGAEFEPIEENPMLGWRGASRYYSPEYAKAFALECKAIKRLRETLGFKNAVVMIPFCRTVGEAKKVLDAMAGEGLRRGDKGLKVYIMCEIPSNVILASRFAECVDGFSIGSNDLTQLTLGVDRDSERLADLFDEQDEAVRYMISTVITKAREAGRKVGLCGQAPSNHPEMARFLVECGIDSISVSPDSFGAVRRRVISAEREISKQSDRDGIADLM